MRTLKQVVVDTGTQKLECRYDVLTHTLLFQNKSHDAEMSLDDFFDRLSKTQKVAKERGYKVTVKEVGEKENWLQGVK